MNLNCGNTKPSYYLTLIHPIMNIRNLLSLLLLMSVFALTAQESGELIESRDGKKYKIVTIDIMLE